jgi:hypothetical protein
MAIQRMEGAPTDFRRPLGAELLGVRVLSGLPEPSVAMLTDLQITLGEGHAYLEFCREIGGCPGSIPMTRALLMLASKAPLSQAIRGN